ncbi:MAG TPA: type VI secretion system ATPase TssH [Chitinispirillaceae bacterium]|nr:type VI secretion system ATPase TssH [Chitinispirillaceae bacterium]
MSVNDIRVLINKLNVCCQKVFQESVNNCISNTNYELTWEHILLSLLENNNNDACQILTYFKIDTSRLKKSLVHEIDSFPTGNTAKPTFSPVLVNLLEKAWNLSSLQYNQTAIRSGILFVAAIDDIKRSFSPYADQMRDIDANELMKNFFQIIEKSSENQQNVDCQGVQSQEIKSELEKYCKNLTSDARAGKIDPILGRDDEIFQVIDILSRRRKNNPILVGEAGVGKTAVIEGLAQYVAADQVPLSLKNVEIWELDLGLLQAGASVKGEFEKRLKSVIDIAKKSSGRIILFIDEAHTLIGAGGAAGMGDAANLLKPALARGELRVCAATTWLEYRKYFEKDPALTRRFQMVKVDEPDEEKSCSMLRGIAQVYEKHHGVHITEEAIKAAVSFSKRYISGRQLPDKAVDVLDTACTRVKMSQTTVPPVIEHHKKASTNASKALTILKNDMAAGIPVNKNEIARYEDIQTQSEKSISELTQQWENEKKIVDKIKELHTLVFKPSDQSCQTNDTSKRDLEILYSEFQNVANKSPMVYPYVSAEVCAQVIADWTGIPVGTMVKDEAQTLLELENRLSERVKGQQYAIAEISSVIRSAKTGITNPDAPLSVFLCTGPSGVGKTECALALADILFGGEKFSTIINMSEYQEKHTVSQLKGSPPGYVGYGEGGVLTEAVRQKPYSIIILEEVEKAHRDVLEMFYQVFDKGIMRDGEGRDINFRNTVIFMTSNLGADAILDAQSQEMFEFDSIRELIRPELTEFFKPALLARCTVIPFMPLTEDVLSSVITLKLKKIQKRLSDLHQTNFSFTEKVISAVIQRCSAAESGARNADMIINSSILPAISKSLLSNIRMGDSQAQISIQIDADDAGEFQINHQWIEMEV